MNASDQTENVDPEQQLLEMPAHNLCCNKHYPPDIVSSAVMLMRGNSCAWGGGTAFDKRLWSPWTKFYMGDCAIFKGIASYSNKNEEHSL